MAEFRNKKCKEKVKEELRIKYLSDWSQEIKERK